jgi:hypothetical protein
VVIEYTALGARSAALSTFGATLMPITFSGDVSYGAVVVADDPCPGRQLADGADASLLPVAVRCGKLGDLLDPLGASWLSARYQQLLWDAPQTGSVLHAPSAMARSTLFPGAQQGGMLALSSSLVQAALVFEPPAAALTLLAAPTAPRALVLDGASMDAVALDAALNVPLNAPALDGVDATSAVAATPSGVAPIAADAASAGTDGLALRAHRAKVVQRTVRFAFDGFPLACWRKGGSQKPLLVACPPDQDNFDTQIGRAEDVTDALCGDDALAACMDQLQSRTRDGGSTW